jgi:hypothetical protein
MFPKVIALLISKHFILDDLVFAALEGRWNDIDVHFAISNHLNELSKLLDLPLLFALAFNCLHRRTVIININIIKRIIIFIELYFLVS